jgi:hypothetical protein
LPSAEALRRECKEALVLFFNRLVHFYCRFSNGCPRMRVIRREVEALVGNSHGEQYLKTRQAKTEVARINRELKRLKTQIAQLEERKSNLVGGSGL